MAKQILSATCIQKWYRPKYRCWIKAAIHIQALRRGYNAREQMKAIGGEIATNGSSEPSTEIETRSGTPETLETPPPQKQPKQSTVPVVVVPLVSKARTPTRAVAPASKPSVQVDEAHDWHVAVLTAFLAEVVVLVCYGICCQQRVFENGIELMLWYIDHICNLV
jgi:hypothetical protein